MTIIDEIRNGIGPVSCDDDTAAYVAMIERALIEAIDTLDWIVENVTPPPAGTLREGVKTALREIEEICDDR